MSVPPRGILLDIEGTTSSIRFVYDQMFPYVRRVVGPFLASAWHDPAVQAAVAQMERDATAPSAPESPRSSLAGADTTPEQARVVAQVLELMDRDAKTTGLKQLQGLIWQAGFEQGELVAHVYDDVPPALRHWQASGRDVRIYSSGSVLAQKLFFAHTSFGDLLPLFCGHYDTTVGGKKESTSYVHIAHAFALPSHELLFVSDIPAELDAAAEAGYQTALAARPENPPVSTKHTHRVITSFDAIC